MNRSLNASSRVRVIALCISAVASVTTLRTASAQAVAPDFSKLVAHRDSFVVMYQGSPLGASVLTFEKSAKGWTIKENTNIAGGAFTQTTTLEMDGKMNPISLIQAGSMQGQTLATDVAFANGRAKGKAMSPAQGAPTSVDVDLELPAGTIESNAMQYLLPAVAWAENASVTLSTFSAGKAQVLPATFTVVGSEQVRSPAGVVVDAWKIQQKGGDGEATVFVSKDAAHRVLRIVQAAQPIEFLLAN